MKLLEHLEKKKIIWLLLTLCFVFFLLRLPSLIEPYWYGDEGVYEVIGQAMDHGRILYRDIWDNKPPLIYVIYALTQGDQPTVKTISLITDLLSVVIFFFLSQNLYKKLRITFVITIVYIVLLGTPILEGNIANAEDFMLLPTLFAAFIISHLATHNEKSKLRQTKTLFSAGLLLGISFLIKIVAVFDFAAFFLFFLLVHLPEQLSISEFLVSFRKKTSIKIHIRRLQPLFVDFCFFLLGFIVPFLVIMLYFASNHALIDFFQATLLSNIGYVGWQNNLFGIPQGLLLLKMLLLVCFLSLVFLRRKHYGKRTLFIITWFVFSLFNIYFSGRPYTHYVIVLVPSFCLLTGLLFVKQKKRKKFLLGIAIIMLVWGLNLQFQFNIARSFLYYQNAVQFVAGQKSVEAYQAFFDPNVPRDYSLVSFITSHTTPTENVFIWGNNPQIYALSHKLPPGKYTVAYHITENNAYDETQRAINQVHSKYVIVLKESQPLPFSLPLYIMRYNTPGATIYERSL